MKSKLCHREMCNWFEMHIGWKTLHYFLSFTFNQVSGWNRQTYEDQEKCEVFTFTFKFGFCHFEHHHDQHNINQSAGQPWSGLEEKRGEVPLLLNTGHSGENGGCGGDDDYD